MTHENTDARIIAIESRISAAVSRLDAFPREALSEDDFAEVAQIGEVMSVIQVFLQTQKESMVAHDPDCPRLLAACEESLDEIEANIKQAERNLKGEPLE